MAAAAPPTTLPSGAEDSALVEASAIDALEDTADVPDWVALDVAEDAPDGELLVTPELEAPAPPSAREDVSEVDVDEDAHAAAQRTAVKGATRKHARRRRRGTLTVDFK